MTTIKVSKPDQRRNVISDLSRQHLGARRPEPIGMADGGFVNNAVKAMTNVFTRKRSKPEPTPEPEAPAKPTQQTMSLSNAGSGMQSIMDKRKAQLDSYADGGKVKGPGTGTSDSIPVNLSKGEYVLPADTTKAIGVKALDAIKNATHTPVKMGAKRGKANGGVISLMDDDRLKQARAADRANAQNILKTQNTPFKPAPTAPAAPTAPVAAQPAGKAYGAGQKVGGGVRAVSGLAAKSAIAAPLAGFGDYQINDADVDSSAMGTLRAVGSGDFGMAGRSLQKGAVEAGLDTLSGLAKGGDFIAGLGGFKPNLTGQLADKVRGDLGGQVTIDPSTAPVVPNIISPAAAAAPQPAAQSPVAPAPGAITAMREPNGVASYAGENVQAGAPITGGRGAGTVSTIDGGRSAMEINQNASRILGEMSAVNDKYHQDFGRGARKPIGRLAEQELQASRAKTGSDLQTAQLDRQSKQAALAQQAELSQLAQSIRAEKDPARRKQLQDTYLALSGKVPAQDKIVLADMDSGQRDALGSPIFQKVPVNTQTGEIINMQGNQPAAAPYQDGQKLKGKDGKMYVVKNGKPELVG